MIVHRHVSRRRLASGAVSVALAVIGAVGLGLPALALSDGGVAVVVTDPPSTITTDSTVTDSAVTDSTTPPDGDTPSFPGAPTPVPDPSADGSSLYPFGVVAIAGLAVLGVGLWRARRR